VAIDRDKVLQAAQKYVEKKKYEKAVLEYRKLIDADPNDARTLLKIGDLQAKQNLHGDAIATYEAVGKLYAQQGFALKAIAVYKQIREIIAKHVPQLEERYAHVAPKLAELYQQLGLTSDALAALDEVASRLQSQQKDQEAIDVFRKIVELDPTNPLPHLRLAEAFSRVKDIDGAVAEFKTAANQLASIGRRDDAIKVLERLLHHRPDAEQARVCAELYLSRGQSQDGMQALAKLQICFQANPRNFDTLSALARAFNAIGQGNKAIEVQKEMARIARDTGDQELFQQIVQHLLQAAPNDEGVLKLSSQLGNVAGDHAVYTRAAPSEPVSAANVPSYEAQAPVASAERPIAQPHSPAVPQSATLTRDSAATLTLDHEQAEGLSYQDLSYQEVTDDEMADVDIDVDAGAYAETGTSDHGNRIPVYDLSDEGEAYDANYNEQAADLAVELQKVIRDANTFRRVRLYSKALDTLQRGFTLDPRAMDVHEVYRDVLIEADQTERAVEEMLVIASLYVDAQDTESAAHALEDVLAFDPQNARAIELLGELGYEIVDENESQATEIPEIEYDNAAEPLPAYDIEEPDVSTGDRESHEQARVETYDGGETEYHVDYVIDEEAAEDRRAAIAQGGIATEDDASTQTAAHQELEDALDEAEFFCSRGLYDDARAILADQHVRYPNNPLLRERLAEIDALEAERGSGAREKPRAQDRTYGVTASLDALESLKYADARPAESTAHDATIDVDEVFSKFKEGIAKQISVEDSESHYNLGIAYKEMMLLGDAIREFEIAARDPQRECVCRSMIGMIESERGNLNEAIQALLAGLNAQVKEPQQETTLCFEVGAAYEAKKMNREALGYYQRTMRRDPNYRDVQERVRRLMKIESRAPMRQAAVGADDEFDRAFNDLVKKA